MIGRLSAGLHIPADILVRDLTAEGFSDSQVNTVYVKSYRTLSEVGKTMSLPPIIAAALTRASSAVILDFEASCLPEPGSYPIEVGACICATGETASWMIHPTAAWLETGVWSTDAETIHGISREQAIAEGQPPAEVLAALTAFVGDHEVLSDSPSAEGFWLRRLAAAAGQEPPFAVGDLDSLLTTISVQEPPAAVGVVAQLTALSTSQGEIDAAREEAARRLPGTHRAGADARNLAEIVRILAGLDDDPPPLRCLAERI